MHIISTKCIKYSFLKSSYISLNCSLPLGHHDASNEYTSVEDAVTATEMALVEGLGGVMTWDINRDCRSDIQE